METKELKQILENEKAIISVNDISKLPIKIEVNGITFFFSMWITAWDKVAIGYQTFDHAHSLISAVIDEKLKTNKSYDIEIYNRMIDGKDFKHVIISVKSFEAAFNSLLVLTLTKENSLE